MKNGSASQAFAEGEVTVRIEQDAIHLKAITSHGDPVELTSDEARELAAALLELATRCDT